MSKVRLCSTIIRTREIPVPSSKGDGTTYYVSSPTLWNDAVCECPGANFRGHCRHIDFVNQNTCQWIMPYDDEDDEYPAQIERCPRCYAPAVDFDMEPELL